MDQGRPPVWQMIRTAVEALGPRTSNVAVKKWILSNYPDTNHGTIQAQIAICTVNHESRVHYPENRRPRIANDPRYDFLYRPERGVLELYDPDRHGLWQIVEREDGTRSVSLVGEAVGNDEQAQQSSDSSSFAAENHLRDYLVQRPASFDAYPGRPRRS